MNVNELVEVFARMNVQEQNDFANVITAKWPHLAIQIKNLLEFYEMVNSEVEA